MGMSPQDYEHLLVAAHLAHFHTKWGFSIKKVNWNLFLEGHRFTTTNFMGMFDIDLKKLDLNACINGVSPKHRLKNHIIRIGVLYAYSPRKIEMQKDSDGRQIVIPPRLLSSSSSTSTSLPVIVVVVVVIVVVVVVVAVARRAVAIVVVIHRPSP
jgi:hypothetical protein